MATIPQASYILFIGDTYHTPTEAAIAELDTAIRKNLIKTIETLALADLNGGCEVERLQELIAKFQSEEKYELCQGIQNAINRWQNK